MSIEIVRTLVGDTDSSEYVLTDSSVSFFLDEAQDNVYLAASMAAEAIAAKYARSVSESKTDSHGIHTQRRDLSDRFKHYKELAKVLQDRYAGSGAGGTFNLGGTGMFAGGISKSAKDTIDSDTDRVAPAFTRTLHDHPERLNSNGRILE